MESKQQKFSDRQFGYSVRLVSISDGKEGNEFELSEGQNLVGRWDPDEIAYPEVDLTPVDPEAMVSRKHGSIEVQGRLISVQDIGSRNGTFLMNGVRLEQGKKYPLRDGDEIVFGKSRLRVKVAKLEAPSVK